MEKYRDPRGRDRLMLGIPEEVSGMSHNQAGIGGRWATGAAQERVGAVPGFRIRATRTTRSGASSRVEFTIAS